MTDRVETQYMQYLFPFYWTFGELFPNSQGIKKVAIHLDVLLLELTNNLSFTLFSVPLAAN